mgnify:CR=1 FL=1
MKIKPFAVEEWMNAYETGARFNIAETCVDSVSLDQLFALTGHDDEQVREGGFAPYFLDHTAGIYPTAASGSPWNAAGIGVKGDVIADLTEDLAAEQKARVTYDNILRLSDDPDVNDAIHFLRQREVVHFQRFGEGLRLAKDKLGEKNVYYMNPSFDKKAKS